MEKHSKSPSDSRISFGLDISAIVLQTLQNVARVSPVPCLQEAAGLALGIVNIIQGIRGNKEAFKRLAADACELVYAILRMHQDQEIVSTTLLDDIQRLLLTLTSIERFTNKMASRRLIVRLISYQSDITKVQQYREELRQSLDVFGVESDICIRGGVLRVEELLKELRGREPKTVGAEKTARGKASQGGDVYKTESSKTEVPAEECQGRGRERVREGWPEGERTDRKQLETEWPAEITPEEREPALTTTPMTRSYTFPQTQPPLFPHTSGDWNAKSNGPHIKNISSGNANSYNITGSYNNSSVRIRNGGSRYRRGSKMTI